MKLIKATLDHFEDYLSIRSEASNLHWLGYQSPPDRTSFYEMFSQRIGSSDRMVFMAIVEHQVVGSLTADYKENSVYIGYSVKEAFRGCRYRSQMIVDLLKLLKTTSLFPKSTVLDVKAWVSEKNTSSHLTAIYGGIQRTDAFEYRKRGNASEKYFGYQHKISQ